MSPMVRTDDLPANPAWIAHWGGKIENIRLYLQRHTEHWVGPYPPHKTEAEATFFCTYTRYLRIRRVASKWLPIRKSREVAKRDLYTWLWHN